MSHTQTVIVYRNPVEQAFWESGIIFPMICAVIVALVVAITISSVQDYLPWKLRNSKAFGNLVVLLTIGSAIATMWYMK